MKRGAFAVTTVSRMRASTPSWGVQGRMPAPHPVRTSARPLGRPRPHAAGYGVAVRVCREVLRTSWPLELPDGFWCGGK
jgi:hypothetical protein